MLWPKDRVKLNVRPGAGNDASVARPSGAAGPKPSARRDDRPHSLLRYVTRLPSCPGYSALLPRVWTKSPHVPPVSAAKLAEMAAHAAALTPGGRSAANTEAQSIGRVSVVKTGLAPRL